MSDIDNLHFAISKALQEVKAYRCHVKDLESLIYQILQRDVDIQTAYGKLVDIQEKYRQQEIDSCSGSSKSPPKT